MEKNQKIMDGYLRLLGEIADNRCRNFRKAYEAYLEHPSDLSRKGKVSQTERKLRSVPTCYGDYEIKVLREQVEHHMHRRPRWLF